MLRVPNEPLPGQHISAADHAALVRYVKHITPRKAPGQRRRMGPGGYTNRVIQSPYYPPPPGGASSWSFNVRNTSHGATGQVQINGDGTLASLQPSDSDEHAIALVDDQPNNVSTGTPPVFPQLAVTGDGYIYVYFTLNEFGQVTTVNVYYGGTIPSPDTTDPAAYGVWMLGTIQNYRTDESGNVKFDYFDAVGPLGITTVNVCGVTVTCL